jgi:UDP-N-acetylglucosamine 1-carboxyvinyltransferase
LSTPSLVIDGGRPLQGSVRAGGSKNAADYALAACLLTGEECILENVPDIEDVRLMARILQSLGAEAKREGGVWRVRASKIDRTDAPSDLAVNQRASFLVMGPLLARFREAACASPGGDVIGARPLDVHIDGLKALGARVTREAEQFRAESDAPRLHGSRFFLDYPSVTGTMNLVFAASLAEGHTTLVNAAAEPEIVNTIEMLKAMGARIDGAGSSVIEIDGVPELRGTRHRVIPDRLEAGLFALAAAATRGDATIEDVEPQHMDALVHKMREAGVSIDVGEHSLRVCGQGREFRSIRAQRCPTRDWRRTCTRRWPPF